MRRVVPVLALLAAVPAFGADSWVEVKSPAFTVVGDGGEKDARRALSHFEQLRGVLKEAWPWATLDPTRPVTVVAVADLDQFRRLVPTSRQASLLPLEASLFVGGPDRNWALLRTDLPRFQADDDTWDNPYRDALHDYVQTLLRLNYAGLPPWLEQGLAEFWGNTVVDGDRVYVGQLIPSHLQSLRERTFMPLSRLFAIRSGAPEYSPSDRRSVFQAEAWALLHMLTVGSDTRPPQLGRLLELLRAGRPAPDAVKEAFGDFAALERDFASYVGRAAFPSKRRPALPEGKPLSRQLSAAEALSIQGALLSAAGGQAEAAALAAEAMRADSGFAGGLELRGLVAWRSDRRDDARQFLERAVQLPGATDFAHALLGQLLFESGKGKPALERAEAELLRAQELSPRFAKAYDTLALVKDASGAPASTTVPLAQRACALEPGNASYRITLVKLLARGGQLPQAHAEASKMLGAVEGDERKALEATIAEISDPKRLPPEAACAGGFGPACQLLGTQYRDGAAGVAKDPEKAAAYFQKGCDGGHAGSCASLGWAYEDGVGVAKDVARSIALYRKGCDGNDRWSCTRLAFALVSGDGVTPDPAEAERLLDKSCAAGDAMGCAKLGSMLRVGEGLAQDAKRAETVLRSACSGGSSWGCGELALLLVGRGTTQDLQEAATLLERACETDAPAFCAMLADILGLGHGIAKDEARAQALYKRACDKGYAAACAKAGGR